MKQDVEYNLARIEGQLARWEATLVSIYDPRLARKEQKIILEDTKQLLTSLRLALDPHRIDVV